ncbi:MAG: DUF4443 domain-containing protein [Thermoplasmata archaeon]
MGRQRLSEVLGLGEGSVRTLLSFLRSRNLLVIDKVGVRLNERGIRELEATGLKTASVNARELSVGECDVAVRVRGAARRVKDGLRQRDAAVMAGADGATTLVFRGGRLLMPPKTDIESSCPELAKEVRAAFELEEGDAIVIGSARSRRAAEDGAIAAAVDLIEGE